MEQSGHCTGQERCIPGCTNEYCKGTKRWRDRLTCVDETECTCLLENGVTLPPASVEKQNCTVCQCIQNNLQCVQQPGCKIPLIYNETYTTEILPGTTHRIPVVKEDCWTEWINIDSPESGFGDFETLSSIRQKYEFCDNPIKIECRDSLNKISNDVLKQDIHCDVNRGLICQNNMNGNSGCVDYEIRFFCPCATPVVPLLSTKVPPKTLPPSCHQGYTDWFSVHSPDDIGEYEHISEIREYYSFCSNENITSIHCRVHLTNIPYDQSDDEGVVCSLQEGLICKNSDQINGKKCSDYEIKFLCDCGISAVPSSIAPSATSSTSPLTTLLTTSSALPSVTHSTLFWVETKETTVPTFGTTSVPAICNYWSNWINEDKPTSGDGDKEFRTKKDLNEKDGFCVEKMISDIQCWTANSKIDYKSSGDVNVSCDLTDGFYCENNKQARGICQDYMIRFYCDCNVTTTESIILVPSTPSTISPCSGELFSLLEDLPDGNFKATSSVSPLNGPQSARIDSKVTNETGGAWTAKLKDRKQFLEIDLGYIQPVYGIITQGHDTKQEWVKSYRIYYSRDHSNFIPYLSSDGKIKSFTGNYNNRDKRKHIFERIFQSRFVRIQPRSYHGQISMRIDLLGCSALSTTSAGFTIPTGISKPTGIPICNDSMGFENMKMNDNQIVVSSIKGDFYSGSRIRLNTKETSKGSGGWVAEKPNTKQFIQIDFMKPQTITGITTQGRNKYNQWVTAYKIQYSNDGILWNDVTDSSGEYMIFEGNFDSDTPVSNYFEKSIRTRYIKIIPLDWNQWIAMRIEMIGCFEPYPVVGFSTISSTERVTKVSTEFRIPTTEYIKGPTVSPALITTVGYLCMDEMGIENGQITDNMIKVSSSREGPKSDGSRARLNTEENNSGTGAWVAGTLDKNQYIEIDFNDIVNLTGVKTQGRDKHDEWVEKFIVDYSDDGISWNDVSDKYGDKVFKGNEDSSNFQVNMFEHPITAKYLRINPVQWNKWISMRLEVLGCFKPIVEVQVCTDKMGLENGQISDDMITVSSSQTGEHSNGSRIRLNTKERGKDTGGWVAEVSDENQFVEIDFQELVSLTGVTTQGRDDSDEWVTKYIVTYSDDGNIWHPVSNIHSEMEFNGNDDASTPKTNMFEKTVQARYLRIIPFEWNNWISMRLEVIGCFKPRSTEATITTIPPGFGITTFRPTTERICNDPMGLENGLLEDSQIYVSSSLSGLRTGAPRIRLNTPEEFDTGGWVAEKQNLQQYVQFDFRTNVALTGITTQGRNKHNEWVKTYEVEYSADGLNWINVLNEEGNEIFEGNYDQDSMVTNHFQNMINARFLKIIPITWNNWISMRIEILGCFVPVTRMPITLSVKTEFTSTVSTISVPEDCIVYGDWINIDHPSLINGKDYEPIEEIISYSNLCTNPLSIECREIMFHQMYNETGQNVICDLSHGLDCEHGGEIGKQCFDYEARIGCYICGNVSIPPTAVSVCPEVPKELVKNCPTSCPPFEMCDGEKCVPSLDCSCYVDGKKYSPGDRVETSACHYCFCQINGHSHCELKKCPLCEKGQRQKLRKDCICECEGCSDDERICITNGECIESSRWCDGIIDCPDDEEDCFNATTPHSCPEMIIPTCEYGFSIHHSYSDDGCPQYECVPTIVAPTGVLPPEFRTCDVDSYNFKTFDESEYYYETCHHILMQDNDEHNFDVTVHKDCSEINGQCKKYLIIHQDPHKIKITEDLRVEYNDQEYKNSQLVKLSQNVKDFSLQAIGNSIIFSSKIYNFEVESDVFFRVQIKITTNLLLKVNGLCGFFTDDPSDDYQKKDGKLTKIIEDFGDSWSVDSMKKCKPEICISNEYLIDIDDSCLALTSDPFVNCHNYIEPYAYLKTCKLFMCECLKNNKTLHNCQCEAYTQYTGKCLKHNPSANLDGWRYHSGCVPTCPPGKEWKECGPACERTCDNLHEDFSFCDASACISGCFCPPGLVKKDDECIEKHECQDCVCSGYGDPHYTTYDNTYYPFQGNCSYVLTRYLDPNPEAQFEVFTTNEDCKEEPNTTCTVAIMVYYNHVLVHFRVNESVSIDGIQLYESDFPFDDFGFKITSTKPPGRTVTITVEAVGLEVRYFELNYGFEVRIPSDVYFNKTEGLCGNCNYNKSDDIMHKDGYLTNDTNDFALSWLASPPEGIESVSDICTTPPPPVCNETTETEKCKKILKDEFAVCHLLIEPDNYIKSCIVDMCHSTDPPASLCRSLTAYARRCAEAGICLENWRSKEFCPASCPEGMHFEQCTSPCMVTCKSKDQDITNSKECKIRTPIDGCVCNGNLILKDGVCVDPFMCDTCDEEGHIIGDTWKPNPCIECRCTPKLRIECLSTEVCAPPICEEGFVLIESGAANDTCCPQWNCIRERGKTCEQMEMPQCKKGEGLIVTRSEEGCEQFKCECDRLKCEPISEPSKLKLGEIVKLNTEECCPFKEIICLQDKCPKKPRCELPRQLFERDTSKNECCPEFDCVLLNQCSYKPVHRIENGIELLDDNPSEQFYKPGEHWEDGFCITCSCNENSGIYEAKCQHHTCPPTNLHEDFVIEEIKIPNKCCPEYKKILCKDNENNNYTVGSTWMKPEDKCSFYECISESPYEEIKKIEAKIACKTECKANEEYVEPPSDSDECCGYCKVLGCLDENGRVRKVGEKWQNPQMKCYDLLCEEQNRDPTTAYLYKNCPAIPVNCPEDKIVRDENDCCDVCTALPEQCQPEVVNLTDTKRIFEVVHRGNLCTNKKPIHKLTRCTGKCNSQTIYSADKEDYVSSCSCCTPSESEEREIELDCVDGSIYPFTFQQPLSCICTPCTGQEQINLNLPKQYQR